MEELKEAVVAATKLHFKKSGQSASLYSHLMKGYESTGYWDPRLNAAPPPILAYLWDIFWELCISRPSDGFALGGIPNSELKAWMELNEQRLSLWELEVLRLLDVEYVKTIHDLASKD